MPQCKLKNCPYNRDRRCVENQLPNCPNLLPDQPAKTGETHQTPRPENVERTPVLTHEALYSGKKLTADEATRILQSNPAQVVVLGGMVESGKTTLLARIFEMFQCGHVAGYAVAGSLTLPEFDKLTWHATMECGATNPTTEHTYRSENNFFLHLRVRDENGLKRQSDLLIADIPGELFPEAVAEESVCKDLCALRRADHVLLFLDSEVLCDPENRHDHCGKVFDFVTRALQTEQIGHHTALHLVVSKCDRLPKDETSEVLQFLENTRRRFQEKFGSQVGGLHHWRLAARPEHPDQPTILEITKLFGVWMNPNVKQSRFSGESPRKADFQRDFCRFGA